MPSSSGCSLQQLQRLGIARVAVLVDVDGSAHRKLRKILAEHGAKTHLALLVAAIGARAGDDGDVSGKAAQQPSRQQRRRPSGDAVVQPDIGGARRRRYVGRDGDELDAGIDHALQDAARAGMVDRDHADPFGVERELVHRRLQRGRRDVGEVVDLAGGDERHAARIAADMVRELAHEDVLPDRQEELQRRRPRGQGHRARRRQVAEALRRLHHALAVCRTDAGPVVQRAVDRRRREAAALCDRRNRYFHCKPSRFRTDVKALDCAACQ